MSGFSTCESYRSSSHNNIITGFSNRTIRERSSYLIATECASAKSHRRIVAAQLASRSVAVNRINHQTRGEGGITQQQPAPLSGLKIVLRGTQQLEEFPQAKQAFLRAAATWERIIESPISIVLDVDFGPKNFDVPFPNDRIIGSTRSQIVGD